MLWALLIALLITKLSGGPEEIFMIPKLNKEIKAQIVEKDRRGEILDLAKEAKKEIKVFGKIRKSKLKEIKQKGIQREVSSDDLMSIYDEYYQARLAMQASLIEKRLTIQDLITEEEWNNLIGSAVLPSEKAAKKIEKSDAKEDRKGEKVIAEIEKAIAKEVTDETRKENLVDALETFSTTLREFIEEGQRMNFKDNELVRSRTTTREDLEGFYKRQNELRYKGTIEYFEIRNVALANTTDDEWKAIVKAMNTILKQ